MFHIWSIGRITQIFVNLLQNLGIGQLLIRLEESAFEWPSSFRHLLKCLQNLSLRDQPLLTVLDMLGADWVGKRPLQEAAASLLPEDYWRPSITAEHQRAHGKQDRLVASVLSIQCYAALGLGASVVHCSMSRHWIVSSSRTVGRSAMASAERGKWAIATPGNWNL